MKRFAPILFAVLIAACGGSPAVAPSTSAPIAVAVVDPTTIPTATPTVVPTPTRPPSTPVPTFAPTPEPTATPEPTPEPTPDPLAGTTDFVVFLDRTSTSLPQILDIVKDVQIDAENYDVFGLESDGLRLQRRAQKEVDWLNAHKPQPCYKALWANGLTTWKSEVLAGKYLHAGNYTRASTYIARVNSALADSNDNGMVEDASAACMADPTQQG